MEKETNDVLKTSIEIDAKSIGVEMAKEFAAEMKSVMASEKAEVEAKAANVVVKANPVISVKERPVKGFDSTHDMEAFAKTFVPQHILSRFNNTKALTTYQNIATDADGGSFDVNTARGILADSVAKYPSFVEDTLQVESYGSTCSFIDHTSDATTYVIGEATAGTESKPGNTTRSITLNKLLTLCPITGETFRYGSLGDIAAQTLDSMARAIAYKKQYLLFGDADGTADTTDGGMTSVVNTIGGVASNSAIYTVDGSWGDIGNDDLTSVLGKVAFGDPNKYTWYCSRPMWSILEGLARSLGGNSYQMQVGQKPIPMLFGYPVKIANTMKNSHADDEISLLFGDLSSCVATGSTNKVEVDISNEFYFDADVVSLRIIETYGQNVFQPGTNGTETSVVGVKFDSAS